MGYSQNYLHCCLVMQHLFCYKTFQMFSFIFVFPLLSHIPSHSTLHSHIFASSVQTLVDYWWKKKKEKLKLTSGWFSLYTRECSACIWPCSYSSHFTTYVCWFVVCTPFVLFSLNEFNVSQTGLFSCFQAGYPQNIIFIW